MPPSKEKIPETDSFFHQLTISYPNTKQMYRLFLTRVWGSSDKRIFFRLSWLLPLGLFTFRLSFDMWSLARKQDTFQTHWIGFKGATAEVQRRGGWVLNFTDPPHIQPHSATHHKHFRKFLNPQVVMAGLQETELERVGEWESSVVSRTLFPEMRTQVTGQKAIMLSADTSVLDVFIQCNQSRGQSIVQVGCRITLELCAPKWWEHLWG